MDGLLNTISKNFFVAFVSLFALAYGATKGQIGLLASVTNFLGMAALLPAARAASQWKRRKPIVLWTGGGVARLAILLMAAIPLLAVEPAMMVPLIIGLNGIRAFASNFGNPAWTAITADLVPGAVRGRYFAGRNIAMAAAALLISPLAGQMVFLLAFVFGMIATARSRRSRNTARDDHPRARWAVPVSWRCCERTRLSRALPQARWCGIWP